MPTIRDVAERAGVSVGTVSHVLAGSGTVSAVRRERVLAAIRDLDYRLNPIARSLKTRQTKMLGAVVADITNPFYPQLVRGAEDAALKRHYILITVNTDDQVEREREVMAMLLARRVDGLLLVPSPNAKDRSHIVAALAAGTPLVAVDRYVEGIETDSVAVNNSKGVQMAMNHLIRLGHKRIAYVGADWELSNTRQRRRGYEQALHDAGIPLDPAILCFGDFRQPSGYRLTKELCLSSDPPTAIFAGNAMMGMGALQAVQELGLKCPQEISIAIFDDLPFMNIVQPHPTAVSQPAYAIGVRAADLLIDRIEGKAMPREPQRIELDPELLVRGSTGPVPARAGV
jgi:LacI family transcriptional regulator